MNRKYRFSIVVLVTVTIVCLFNYNTSSKNSNGCKIDESVQVPQTTKPLIGYALYRTHSLPYISGDTFRFLSQFVFDDTTQNVMVELVKENDIIFVLTELLGRFFTEFFPKIKVKIIIITHNSDLSAPGEKYISYLENPNITAWFTANPSVFHPKLIPIPIGFVNAIWKSGNVRTLSKAEVMLKIPWHQRKYLLYINYDMRTNIGERKKYYAAFKNLPGVLIVDKPVDSLTYLSHLGNSKFVLSPPGTGIDCHRHWESTLMGAIPIVKNSTLYPLFNEGRFLILSNFDELKLEMLENPHMYIKNMTYTNRVCFIDMWLEKINNFRFNKDFLSNYTPT